MWRGTDEAATVTRMQLTDSREPRFRPSIPVIALLCAWLAACTSQAPPAPPPPSADVWAVVGGREIRKDDVEQAYRRIAPLDTTPSEDEAIAARLRILNELIDQDILLDKGKSMKIEVSPADLDKAFTERKSNMSEDAFQKELKQRDLTADDMKRALGREMTVRKLLEQEVVSKVKITDEAIREFYDKNRQQFNIAEPRYRIAQIVITPVRDAANAQPGERQRGDARGGAAQSPDADGADQERRRISGRSRWTTRRTRNPRRRAATSASSPRRR